MTLATLGCTVNAVERVAAFAFLAHDVVVNSWLAERCRVAVGEAETILAQLGPDQRPEIVYLDPMFRDHGNAQVKKDMQVCRALAAAPTDDAALFAVARAVARERVVVKRDADGPPLAAGVSFAVPGERVRFDVYLATPVPR